MTSALVNLAFGAALAAIVAVGGWRARALTAGGAAGAVLVGGAVFGVGGLLWGALLVVFFVSSSALSRLRGAEKARAEREFAKGGRRDLGQVLANGGVPALLALAQLVRPELDLTPAFVGAIAAVTADTWATEVGLLSRGTPRLITTGRRVPAGTSGAVTGLGLGAALAGGLAIGTAAAGLVRLAEPAARIISGTADLFAGVARIGVGGAAANAGAVLWPRLLLVAPVAALAAALADSLLGATTQAMYRCPRCDAETERRIHHCGEPTRLVRGLPFMTNDAVNLAASAIGALVAAGLYAIVLGPPLD